MSAKETVLELVAKMPDDVTMEDVLEELYVRQKIEIGLRQLDAGQGVLHEEARKRLVR